MRKKIFLLFLSLSLFLQPDLNELNSGSIQAKKDQEELKYEVTVALKLVQVYVTDKKGNPVTDLKKSDFILYDNGKLQTVTDFENHIFKPEKEIKEVKPDIAQETSPLLNRKFFFLIDYGRNNLNGLNKSKKVALHFIDTQLQPTDEVGVLSYSRLKGLILHEYLTTDHQKAREAINKMRGILNLKVDPNASGEEMGFEKAKAREFTIIIKEFSKSLRYIPGNKNIILFSQGFSGSWMNDIYDSSFRDLFEDMCKELASSSTPVYTVNTFPRHLRDLQQGDSLKILSDLSGGEYFPIVDYNESIASSIQKTTSNYYVLGYYISEKLDGKYHELKVKVNRKGCEVYAQGGFFNSKPFTEFSKSEKRIHLFDLAISENPQFQVPTIFPSIALPCSENKESNLLILSEIPINKIKEITKGKTEVLTLILDEENNFADYIEGEINFHTFSSRKIFLYSISSLLPGKYECRLVIRDIKTGKGAVASSSVVIPKAVDSGLKLFPPLLLISEKEGLYLKLSENQKKEKEKGSLSINDIYPFVSNNISPLVEEVNQEISSLLAVLRLSIIDIPDHEIEFSVHLINHSTQKKVQLTDSFIISNENIDGTEVLLIEIQLPELEPGSYSLEFVADERTTQTKSQVTRDFIIK